MHNLTKPKKARSSWFWSVASGSDPTETVKVAPQSHRPQTSTPSSLRGLFVLPRRLHAFTESQRPARRLTRTRRLLCELACPWQPHQKLSLQLIACSDPFGPKWSVPMMASNFPEYWPRAQLLMSFVSGFCFACCMCPGTASPHHQNPP